MLPIKYLTIHCAATPPGRHHSAAEISQWDINKFGQISYHWVVELDGKAVRTLPDNKRGAHVGLANTGNIGICYVGGVDKAGPEGKALDTRTAWQKETLKRLILEYQKKYPGIEVRGHHDWPRYKSRGCPSFDVAAWLKAGMPT